MERVLREDKLLETAERLQKRIAKLFPESGLTQIAAEIVQITREAMARAERIRRPDLLLRGGLAFLALLAVAGVVKHFSSYNDSQTALRELLQFMDATKGAAAFMTGAAIFLVTLEVRLKRRRALRAIHELRAMAHIIDMHQLTKDPDRLGRKDEPLLVGAKVMDADLMGRYLNYCTELLAIVSKIGQLYVQDFPDSTAQSAVDHFESLATNLSEKIWQKIMILDRIRAAEGEEQASGEA
jgi:hypothetical protein